MAVTARAINSSLIILVEDDVKTDGTTIYASRSIGRIDPALTDEKAYSFAAAVGALQKKPVGEIQRTTKSELVSA